MTKELELSKALNGLANFIIMHGNNDDYDASAMEWHGILKTAIIELKDLRESNKEMRKLLDEAYSKMPHTNDCAKGEMV